MKKHLVLGSALALLSLFTPRMATANATRAAQVNYEREVNAVVRNKYFYKAGRFEITGDLGAMPYDSLVNHYMLGGKLTWHLSDHYGWEMLDLTGMFPSIASYTTNLVQTRGISDLQAVELHYMVGSNFLLSPIYGKIRFIGDQVLYFDMYFVLGGGLAKAETLEFSTTQTGGSVSSLSVANQMDPMVDFGMGFKVFVTNSLGVIIDFRDYLVDAQSYGTKSLKSNYSVMAGLSFFVPNF